VSTTKEARAESKSCPPPKGVTYRQGDVERYFLRAIGLACAYFRRRSTVSFKSPTWSSRIKGSRQMTAASLGHEDDLITVEVGENSAGGRHSRARAAAAKSNSCHESRRRASVQLDLRL